MAHVQILHQFLELICLMISVVGVEAEYLSSLQASTGLTGRR